MRFCVKKGVTVSRWYDYPFTVEEFVEKFAEVFRGDSVWCFVENEHVWLYDVDGLYQCPEVPDWVLDFDYPEYDIQ